MASDSAYTQLNSEIHLASVFSSFTPSHSLFCQTLSAWPGHHVFIQTFCDQCQGIPKPVHPASSNLPDPKMLVNILWQSPLLQPQSLPRCVSPTGKGLRLTLVPRRLVKTLALWFSCWMTTGFYYLRRLCYLTSLSLDFLINKVGIIILVMSKNYTNYMNIYVVGIEQCPPYNTQS